MNQNKLNIEKLSFDFKLTSKSSTSYQPLASFLQKFQKLARTTCTRSTTHYSHTLVYQASTETFIIQNVKYKLLLLNIELK